MIRVPQVRVVDEEGSQRGVMPTLEALRLAQERGYDLVEVAPMASPPVVRFLDFGQYKYELTKREKEAKRKQRSVTFKEVRLKPKIGQGDFDTKVRRAIEFLEEGDRIKVSVQFRGRELTHPEIGREPAGAGSRDQIKDHGDHRAGAVARRQVDAHHGGIDPQAQEPRGTGRPTTRPGPSAETSGGRRPDSTAIDLNRRPRDRAATPAAAPRHGPRRSRRLAARRRPPVRRHRQHRQPRRAGGVLRIAHTSTTQTRRPGSRTASERSRADADSRPRHRRPANRQHDSKERETSVPKLKSHKGAQKRIGVTGSGKPVRVKSWRGHHLEIKSSRRTRRYDGKACSGAGSTEQVKRLLPYLGKG